MMRRITAVLAAAVLAFGLSTAVPANAATATPGTVWSETLPTGERVQFQRSPEGMDITTHALIKRDLFSCSAPYTCVWTGTNYSGTFGRYNTNNIYSNTANGVAHCWNMSAPFNNNTASWANFSPDRGVQYNNWINCNINGGQFLMSINSHWDCTVPGYQAWCTGSEAAGYPRTTSIRATS